MHRVRCRRLVVALDTRSTTAGINDFPIARLYIRDRTYIFPRGTRRQSKCDKLFSFCVHALSLAFFFVLINLHGSGFPSSLAIRPLSPFFTSPSAVSPSRHQGRHGRRGRERARDSKKGIIRERTGSQL